MSQRTPELMDQQIVFPELLSERIEQGPHAARFFRYLVNVLDLNLQRTSALGTPPYCRSTLLASIFYAMFNGHFESRQIASFLGDSIGAQWILQGMTIPSFMTIERVINALLMEVEEFFIQILELCDSFNLIGKERTYIDGTKKQANASKHKAMSYEHLIKKIGNGKDTLKLLFKELRSMMDGFEDLTDTEFESFVFEEAETTRSALRKSHRQDLSENQHQIFNIDIEARAPENKTNATENLKTQLVSMANVEPENQEKAVEILSDIAFTNSRLERMVDAKTTLESKWEKEHGNTNIPAKKQINFTDPDSGIMQTKHHGVQQCYNHFAIVDDRANIILGTYTSNSSSDQLGLKPTVWNTERTFGSLKGIVLGGDAGFFSAANISFAIEKGIDFYASFPEAKSPYAKDKFMYDAQSDSYTCPEGNILSVQSRSEDTEKRKYSNESACLSCPNGKDCAKAKDGVRRIERDMVDDKLREDGKEKTRTDIGKDILKQRKHIPEPVFGNMKTQDGFTQMHYRGIEKSGYEFDLRCAFQNIRKLFKVYLSSTSFQNIVHSSEHYESSA
jgi:transposase